MKFALLCCFCVRLFQIVFFSLWFVITIIWSLLFNWNAPFHWNHLHWCRFLCCSAIESTIIHMNLCNISCEHDVRQCMENLFQCFVIVFVDLVRAQDFHEYYLYRDLKIHFRFSSAAAIVWNVRCSQCFIMSMNYVGHKTHKSGLVAVVLGALHRNQNIFI